MIAMELNASPSKRLKQSADYLINAKATVSTTDNQDHTFYGIMFDVEAREQLAVPYSELYILSLWVRGDLGHMRVWHTRENGSHKDRFHDESLWLKVCDQQIQSRNMNTFYELILDRPIVLAPGDKVGVYIHSDDCGNAVVYDDERSPITFENSFVRVHSGLAQVTNDPFCVNMDAAGRWPWRVHREFVGRISFAVKYVLWRPVKEVHSQFPESFRKAAITFIWCMRTRLFDDLAFQVLNLCGFEWFQPQDQPSVIELQDTRRKRCEGVPIGWEAGDWRDYQSKIMNHYIEYMRRVAPPDAGEEESDDDDEEDMTDSEMSLTEDDDAEYLLSEGETIE